MGSLKLISIAHWAAPACVSRILRRGAVLWRFPLPGEPGVGRPTPTPHGLVQGPSTPQFWGPRLKAAVSPRVSKPSCGALLRHCSLHLVPCHRAPPLRSKRPPPQASPLKRIALLGPTDRRPIAPLETSAPCVTFRLVVFPLQGPGQPPVLPFACCVGSLLSAGRCSRCSCWCRFRVCGAQ